MKQLSGLDASFLAAEDEHRPTHISVLLVLRKPSPDFDAFAAWRRQVASRLHLVEPLRRRLVEVPFDLDHPYWIADPDFDLDFHVRHSAVPAPGTDAQLDELVGRLVAGPMDRDHPLWASHVIDGLADDRFAVLMMVHHAAVDGAAAEEMIELLLDDSPDAEPADEVGTWSVEDPPSPVEVLARAAVHGVERPGRALLLAARAAQDVARASRLPQVVDLADRVRAGLRGRIARTLNLGRARDADAEIPRLPALFAPHAPFNAPISRYRHFEHRSVSLSAVREVGERTDATVNDVVVTLCAGGLRRWLEGRGELPREPLTAMVPVSLRSGTETDPWSNRVSGMVASLPTDIADPAERLRAAHDGLSVAKRLFRLAPSALVPDAVELGVPAGITALSRAVTRWITAAPTPFNLIISNVPGPTDPLHLGGATMTNYFPVSAIADGQGLNVTVQSYVDRLDIGLLGCARLLPDLADLADAIVDELDVLCAATARDASA